MPGNESDLARAVVEAAQAWRALGHDATFGRFDGIAYSVALVKLADAVDAYNDSAEEVPQ